MTDAAIDTTVSTAHSATDKDMFIAYVKIQCTRSLIGALSSEYHRVPILTSQSRRGQRKGPRMSDPVPGCSSELGKSNLKNREPPHLSYAFPHHTDMMKTRRMTKATADVNNVTGESPST